MKVFKVLMFLIVCLFPLLAVAQDVITLKNGDEIQAKVTEVGQTEVKYKRFDNPDGPTYNINKSDVFMVKYQNGLKDVFKDEQPAQNTNNNGNNDDGEFWKSRYWTNQRIAGISLFADLGGFGFTGPRAGMEVRYRRFQVNGFYKYGGIGAMNTVYLDDNEAYSKSTNISGHGGGYTVKVLLPVRNSNSTFHVGVINEWAYYTCSFNEATKTIDWTRTAVGSTGLGCGFSYHTDKGFYFTLGGYWGMSVFNLEYTTTYYHQGSYYYEPYTTTYYGSDSWVAFFGIAEVTLGWEFCLYRKK